ncbi:hypothetical protein [Acinetobacter phage P1068]|uniref:Uncharacterized protein n=3 Tax=Viruses TaxID=10239 RepID=A0AAU8KYW9_9VIRU|nr:hypothetical protein [Acinetobacter phage P1068]
MNLRNFLYPYLTPRCGFFLHKILALIINIIYY